jgi:hypothetical protein
VLRQRLRDESPRWVPGPLDDRIFAKIFGRAQELLVDLTANPDHELRRDIDLRLMQLVGRLRADPEFVVADPYRCSNAAAPGPGLGGLGVERPEGLSRRFGTRPELGVAGEVRANRRGNGRSAA